MATRVVMEAVTAEASEAGTAVLEVTGLVDSVASAWAALAWAEWVAAWAGTAHAAATE